MLSSLRVPELLGRPVARGVVQPGGIVSLPPGRRDAPGCGRADERALVEALVAQPPRVAHDARVLHPRRMRPGRVPRWGAHVCARTLLHEYPHWTLR